MSRLPPALARRIDRLARRAHAFHRWAHHPLCSRYAAEVVPLGRRTRVCLGCSLVGTGATTGVALGLALPALSGPSLLAAGAILLAGVPAAVTARPSTGSGRAEPPGSARSSASGTADTVGAEPVEARTGATRPATRKLLTRLAPALTAALLAAQALRAPSPARLAAASLAAAAVAWAVARYRRRGPDRSACEGCPEGPPTPRCPGLGPVFRRERAMSRLAWRWIDAALPAQAPGAATSPPPRPPPAAPRGPATAGPPRSS